MTNDCNVQNIFKFYLYSFREQLLHVLLRITTLVLNKKPPRRKDDTLSGKLAPAIFQVIK